MARKRTKQKSATARAESKAPTKNDRDAKPIPFTLEQALAELDRLTPWSRSLPICKALLQVEIKRLRAESDDDSAGKCAGHALSAVHPVQAAPVGPLSRESSAEDDAKDTPEAESILSEPVSVSPQNNDGVPMHSVLESKNDNEVKATCLENKDSDVTIQTSNDAGESVNDAAAASAEQSVVGSSANESIASLEKACTLEREKAQLKIRIPIEEYPGYNFIGRLLGPRGATLKHLEISSQCRLYIRGRGSLRSSDINHELSKASLPGFEHLNEDLHVLVEYEGPPEESERCLGIASRLVAPLLVPPASDEQDELKKQQLKELAILNGTYKENKQLLPVSNKRVTCGAGPSCNSNNWGAAANSLATAANNYPNGKDANLSTCQTNAGPGGLNANVMMQVVAQQLFLQEQHKHAQALSMRLVGMQQAQHHAMAARQQTLSSGNSGNHATTMPAGLHGGMGGGNGAAPNLNNVNSRASRAFAAMSNTHNPLNDNKVNDMSFDLNRAAPQRVAFGAINGASQGNTDSRGRNPQVSTSHNRSRVVSVDAKPFVPPLSRQTVDAQPFVPNPRLSTHQRGRSSSQGVPQQRSYSQGPPMQHSTGGEIGCMTSTPGKGLHQYGRTMPPDENFNPQFGEAPGQASPSFLTSIPSTPPTDRQGGLQKQEAADVYSGHAQALRTGSSPSSGGLDDSVDRSWGAALPFDPGWEGGDADSESSFYAKNCGRAPPPGARALQRWHPYSRSPPKGSPDFSAKVEALCSASFGSGLAGKSGSYSLF